MTWTAPPELVEKVAREITAREAAGSHIMLPAAFVQAWVDAQWRANARNAHAALAASRLGEAIGLLERLVAAQTEGAHGIELWLGEVDQLIIESRVFLTGMKEKPDAQ
jgi:hypothetical protein